VVSYFFKERDSLLLDHLLCVPDSYGNESINGYIQRIALENGYENANWIYSLKGIHKNLKTRTTIENDLLLLSKLLNKDYNQLLGLTYLHTFSENSDRLPLLLRQGVNRHSKYCPECFKETGYHNKYWDISYNIFCYKHNLRLIDFCPNCQKALSSNLKNLFSCLCGYQLFELPKIEVPKEYTYIGKLIEGIFNRKKDLKEPYLNNLTPGDFSFLILFIIHYLYYERYREHSKIASSFNNPKVYTEVIVETFNIFTFWPTSFYEFLNEFGKTVKRKDRKTGITTYFGNFYTRLYSQFTDSCFDFIKEEFENYL
jgi:hypothetical protein